MDWSGHREALRDSPFEHLGEDVVYTAPNGGAAEPIRAIFGDRPVVVEDLEFVQSLLNSHELFLEVRVADLARGKLESEATVLVGGVLYKVRALSKKTDMGYQVCSLQRPRGG